MRGTRREMRSRFDRMRDLTRMRDASPFESRTEVWREVGLGAEIDRGQVRRARSQIVLGAVLLGAVIFAFSRQDQLFPGLGTEVQIATVVAIVAIGWALARALGRGLAPTLFRRMDPSTAGTVGFLIRLFAIFLVGAAALRIAGLDASALAVGGAFTAVVLGLAAQQTIGNLFAGLVLLSTRPFRVGERVKLLGGMLAGQVDGIVGQLGLFYTTLISGADRIMVPNSMVINLAVIPMREPDRVELRARFDAEMTPDDVQDLLEERISVPMRYEPHITLEELDGDQVVVQVAATPQDPTAGGLLAADVMAAIRDHGGGHGAVRTDHGGPNGASQVGEPETVAHDGGPRPV
jgi:small conductance mechanosensitive channel